MDITIYQINMGRDHNRIAFEGLDLLKMYQGSDKIDSRIYDRVFEGEVDCKDLEDVYRKFNLEHPEGYKGRSLSVSDVVEIVDENGDSTFHFCDSIGFKQIDFDPYLTEEYKEDKIKVVLCEPGKVARVAEISNTLAGLQKTVKGDIEQFCPYEEAVAIICNEEGKFNGMMPNRAIYSEPQEVEMSYGELTSRFREAERNGGEHLTGYIVFTEDSFAKPYPEAARTYAVSSNNNEERVNRYEERLRREEQARSEINSSQETHSHQTTAQNKNTVRQRKSAHQQSTVRETASTGGEVRKNAVRGKRNQTIKTAERTEHTIKQSARSAGKKTVKTGAKGTVKSSEKAIKTAEKTSKAAIKTAERTAKATQKAAQATAKAAQKAAEMARQAAIAAYKAAVAAAKAIAAAIKAIAAAIKELIAAIAAGGWVAVVVIIVICLIGLIVASCFGIFFSSEDTGSTQTMQQVVQEINLDYQNKLDDIKNSNTYDELEMSGSRAVWPEVLSIYAVKTTNDPDNPQEVASMTDEKKQLLKDIFWEMNEISYETEEKTETVIIETDDGEGNIIEEEVEETTVYLYITVSHKTVEEMMAQYGFAEDQKVQVAELLAQDSSMWASVLYGIYGADDQIVAVALSQLGNVGGEPYWSWYGFGSRVEWCACFVSWCADQCGYIETGVIPKYAGCVNGVNWFKDRGQWADNDIEPAPGMIIFFDWDNKGSSGPQDGESDHTGIVERVEDGIVYTVEGNSGDSCRENHYAVGYYEILGYGIPAY